MNSTAACILGLATLALPCAAQSLVRAVNGPAANAQFGKACIVVADQNGDGFKDLIVGAPGFNQQRGAIYCVSGAHLANGGGSSTLWSLAPTANQGDLFGSAIGNVGDVTGDGVADFLVGQPGYDITGFNDVGAVRLVNGASHIVQSSIFGQGTGAVLGSAIAATGDLDHDNRSEVLIGAPGFGTSTSRVYLVRGSNLASSGSITTLLAATLTESTGSELGASLASGFEVHDYGTFVVSTFYVGAPGFDGPAGSNVGKVVRGDVTFGGNNINIDVEYVSSVAGERLGTSVDAAHDYDGDGAVDVLAGAPNSPDGSGSQVGRVVVLSGARLQALTPPYEIDTLTTAPGNFIGGSHFHFGTAVRACADLNGDGVGEILVGAPDYFGGAPFPTNYGFVAIHSGSSRTRLATIYGSANDHFGDALANAVNDYNGDGFKEFVVAGALSDVAGTDSGVIKCYRLFPLAPSIYCTSKTNSLGCTPAISFSGSPSASSAAAFTITASNFLNQKNGLLFYSHAPTSVPFQGGTKCAANPTLRTPPMSSGGSASGNDCTGTYGFNFNGWLVNGWDLTLGAGSEIYAQYWSRDPQSASHTSLSNAIRFVVNP